MFVQFTATGKSVHTHSIHNTDAVKCMDFSSLDTLTGGFMFSVHRLDTLYVETIYTTVQTYIQGNKMLFSLSNDFWLLCVKHRIKTQILVNP